MDNGVVLAIARALVARGPAVLRFNFGGVGRSQGTHSGGPEEIEDVRSAVTTLARKLPSGTPLTLVGYSFGAWVGLLAAGQDNSIRRVIAIAPPLSLFEWSSVGTLAQPLVIIAGDRDQFCGPDRLVSVMRARGDRVAIRTIAGADHFFVGIEDQVAGAVADCFTEHT
jgi:alpha/beta superfamily hydrolase